MAMNIMFLIVIAMFVVVGVGFVLIYAGIRGVPELSAPRCAKCRYDLRTLRFDGGESSCPECGADLTKPGAANFGEYHRRPWKIVGGVVALALPFLAFFALIQLQNRARPATGPSALPGQSNTTILANLPKVVNEPWSWNELERRMKSGMLKPVEVDQAIAILTADIVAARAAGKQPGNLPWAQSFVQGAIASGNVSAAQAKALYVAFYNDSPNLKFPASIRLGDGTQTFFDIQATQFEIQNDEVLIWSIREEKLDGKVTPFLRNAEVPPAKMGATRDYLSNFPRRYMHGQLMLPPETALGEHEVELTFDLAVVPSNARMMGIDGRAGTPDKWPKTTCSWTKVVKQKFKLIGADEESVALVTDAARDPVARGGLALRGIATRLSTNGVTLIFDWVHPSGAAIAPILGELVLRGDGFDQKLGTWGWGPNVGFGSEWTIRSLPPGLKSVDVILTPAPRIAEKHSHLNKETWGRPIEFKNVPLERHDLPATKPE